MTYSPGISVVVTNYRTSWDLARFLRSLAAHPPSVPWSIAIMNVDPKADDKEVAEDFATEHENATVVSFDSNVGYARACNRGAQLSAHEVIALFNADVRITARSLDACYEALLSDDTWGVLGPRQVDDQGLLTAAGIFGSQRQPQHRGWQEHDRGQYQDVRDDAVVVAGSAYFIRRSLWDQLRKCPIFTKFCPEAEGAFLVAGIIFFEETACSYHASVHGFKNVFFGPATLIHRFHQSVKGNDLKTKAKTWFLESKVIFQAFCESHGIDHD